MALLPPALSRIVYEAPVDCRLVAGGFGGADKRRGKDSRPGFKVDQHKTAIQRAYDAGTSTGGEGKALSAGYMSRSGLERRCGSLHRSLGAGKERERWACHDQMPYLCVGGGRTPRCEMPACLFCRSGLDAAPSESRSRYLEYLMVRSVGGGGYGGTRSESSSGDGDLLERRSQRWGFPMFQGRGFPPGQCPSPSYRPEWEGNNQIISAFHDESGVETRAWCCAPPPRRSSSARRATLLGLMLGGPVV